MKKTTPLRNLRRTRTISQAELAGLLGVSQQTLSKFENGRIVPSWDMQARIAAILGVSPQELFPAREAVTS